MNANWILYLALFSILTTGMADGKGKKELVVAQDGSGDYSTVQAALDAVPAGNATPFTIRIKKGVYYEALILDKRKTFVTLIGEDPDSTILTYNNHAGKVMSNGDTINTWTSASFFIYGDDFTAENLTFRNDAGFSAGQAVALYVYGNRAAFRNCRLTGFQDVLFCSGPGTKQYYENCYVEGTTDFIFGPATAVFLNCHVHSKKKSHVTAASTPREIPFGFVFLGCRFTADSTLRDISLGRPWQPNASVTYINCWLDKHIAPWGWHNWNNPNNEKTVRYAEYSSSGPGANPAARVPWSRQLTASELKKYALDNILGAWKPYPPEARLPERSNWSTRMAATILETHPAGFQYPGETKKMHLGYETGVILKAFEQLWIQTGDELYLKKIRQTIDPYLADNGIIQTYKLEDYNLDNITIGRLFLLLFRQTGQEKYRLAAQTLRKQLATQPRTHEGGFWHKKVYPYQMWLDGLYMAEPFYAEYSSLFNESANFDDIVNQFVWMDKHARDEKTGLLYHGWDESRQQKWANPATGQSPNFWSRAMGWYAMALVDVLDYLPRNHPRRGELVAIFQRLMPAIARYQDPIEGCWYQVTDRGGEPGNYLEASASGMFVYALAKGVRMGYLPLSMMANAQKGYTGMLRNFISADNKGMIHLDKTVSVSGLGGKPYRDGSFAYYIGEPLRRNDLKGAGPFILASLEMEKVWVQKPSVIVAPDGSGQFRSIQEAINSLDTGTVLQQVIFIKNGTYQEKLFIDKNRITLRGESEQGVIITASQARDIFRCSRTDDWGAATVNAKGSDLVFENLTVINSFGFDLKQDTTVACADAPEGKKVVTATGHQFAFRSFPGAYRLIFRHCTFRALGGDTVSPWDVDCGMYYFKDCTMEGGVDFYCPRGWAYAENCRFICHNKEAAIWHDGSKSASSRTVLKNCRFEGDPGYKLGRYHRESQFFLLDCSFSKEMADADIYWAKSGPGTPLWGRRVNFFNCHREGGDYPWHQDNLTIDPGIVTPEWTYEGKWNPLSN